jgi:hypothetical protein
MRGSTSRELHAFAAFVRQLDGIKERFTQAPWHATDAPDSVDVLPPPAAAIFIDDWDDLLCAIQDCLRQAVSAAPAPGQDGASEPVRACVLECVQALHQLRVLLLHAGPRPRGAEGRGAWSAPMPRIRSGSMTG